MCAKREMCGHEVFLKVFEVFKCITFEKSLYCLCALFNIYFFAFIRKVQHRGDKKLEGKM